MLKKLLSTFLIISLLVNLRATADEGMWIPLLLKDLNYRDMKRMGLQLTAEEIYSINKSSLKDAIVQLGNGCTGVIVSKDGLLLTNHHCAFHYIQSHSTIEHNYLAEGFWAMTREEEFTNEGLSVKFLVRIEDVTDKILSELHDTLTEKERNEKVQKLSDKISKHATKDTYYNAYVKSFFGGNDYYLFVYEIYKDVRLVGAPPSAIGKFGGNTDNWMWPRHTGDFAVFRVYMSPDGKPAKYSADNVPYKSKYHLPVTLNGVKENDFSMILGYAGRTDRYLTSYGVKQAINITNPAIVKIRDKKLSILREEMSKSNNIRLKYSSKYAATSNYWKYFIGQTNGIRRLNVLEKKKALENEFQKWIDEKSERKAKYGNVLNEIEQTFKQLEKYNLVKAYYNEATFRGPDVINFAVKFLPLYELLSKEQVNEDDKNKLIEKLKKETEKFYRDFNLETEKKLFANLLKMFFDDIDKEYHPTIFNDVEEKYKGDFNKFTDIVYRKSIFADKKTVLSFLNNPSFKTLDKDLGFRTMYSIRGNYKKYELISKPIRERLAIGNRTFIQGLREMQSDKIFYPDANSTMRLTYGKVMDYVPRDAVEYDFYTTFKGVVEKEDDMSDEFVVPIKLKELYSKKDYGQYGENQEMKVCFITNNDITGGNSGSPVINGKGELTGLAFDGNWEAMSSDIAFEPDLQRTIIVDIRYVLFIIDKFAGAKHLIEEMTVIDY